MTAPVLEDYKQAFYEMEGNLNRIEQASKVLDYLAGRLIDAVDEKKACQLAEGTLAETTALAAFMLADTIKTAEQAYYERFNELVDRENEELKVGRAQS